MHRMKIGALTATMALGIFADLAVQASAQGSPPMKAPALSWVTAASSKTPCWS
jgi:hypothetical protein